MVLAAVGQPSFGELHFGQADLGDQRRTRRLVALADQLVRHPGGTLPEKVRSPSDLKALYRLMDADAVTHDRVLAPHRQYTQTQIAACTQVVLLIHDATELDFTTRTTLTDLGQIGKGTHRGYICHNSLAVTADRQVLGLRQQILHRRPKVPKKETKEQKRRRRDRESRLWVEAVRAIGDSPPGVVCVDIGDRNADTFEFLEYELQHGRPFVIRSKSNRRLLDPDAPARVLYLHDEVRRLSPLGSRPLRLEASAEHTARDTTVSIAATQVWLRPPKQKRGDHGEEPLAVWAVRVWEAQPVAGEELLEWILLTAEPAGTWTQACQVVDWYAVRPVVEEYHKGQKTGCGLEKMQFTTRARLEPAIALQSVIAVTLLQLRDASRRPDAKQRRATEFLAKEYVEVLSSWRHKVVRLDWSLHDFYYALARLGGHQNRKGDRPPGWLVLWRGWTALHDMDMGADAYRHRKKCG